eukprot:CAMPEP_0198283760 /NCGR_PEP_ID=MMETSP1449-20131203/3349_1 /TAXON_ID=420275 /ORGANISM="Attheya septentrionalis, Strain CCMP2084" /LENGTH=408 /DNA_ID=CAMNT_0043980565 /DNA_START=159 /DNA_END=1385 /DNA_ORIENTATION=-
MKTISLQLQRVSATGAGSLLFLVTILVGVALVAGASSNLQCTGKFGDHLLKKNQPHGVTTKSLNNGALLDRRRRSRQQKRDDCQWASSSRKLLQIRCGGNNNEYEYDDEENDLYDNSGDDEYSDGEYDEENEEEEGDAPASATLQRRPVAHNNNHDNMRRPPPPARRPPPPRQKSNPTMLGMASKLAKKTASMTKTVAVSSVKGSGKAAYYLASPKHVTRRELWGVWRLDQQVGKMPDGPFVSCAANVELTPKGEAITKFGDSVDRTPYTFVERSWPRSCYVDFEARAFQGPNDDKPVLFAYRGYFQRKMADKSVIKIVGTIHRPARRRSKIFGGNTSSSKPQGPSIGTFVARRRLVAPPSENDSGRKMVENIDDDYDGEYDDESNYDGYDAYDDEYDDANSDDESSK